MRLQSFTKAIMVLGIAVATTAAAARPSVILPGKIDIPVVQGGSLDEPCGGGSIDPHLDACVRVATASIPSQLEAYARVLKAKRWVHGRPASDDNVHLFRRDWGNQICEGLVIQSFARGAQSYIVFSYVPKDHCAALRGDK